MAEGIQGDDDIEMRSTELADPNTVTATKSTCECLRRGRRGAGERNGRSGLGSSENVHLGSGWDSGRFHVKG